MGKQGSKLDLRGRLSPTHPRLHKLHSSLLCVKILCSLWGLRDGVLEGTSLLLLGFGNIPCRDLTAPQAGTHTPL